MYHWLLAYQTMGAPSRSQGGNPMDQMHAYGPDGAALYTQDDYWAASNYPYGPGAVADEDGLTADAGYELSSQPTPGIAAAFSNNPSSSLLLLPSDGMHGFANGAAPPAGSDLAGEGSRRIDSLAGYSGDFNTMEKYIDNLVNDSGADTTQPAADGHALPMNGTGSDLAVSAGAAEDADAANVELPVFGEPGQPYGPPAMGGQFGPMPVPGNLLAPAAAAELLSFR